MNVISKSRTRNFFSQGKGAKLAAVVAGIAVLGSGYLIMQTSASGFFATAQLVPNSTNGDVQIVPDATAGLGEAISFGISSGVGTAPGYNDYPNATNTGYPKGLPGDTRAKVTLKPYTGPMTITTPGTVLDGVEINIGADDPSLTINTYNVVIRNSLIRVSNLGGSPEKPAVRTYNDNANLLIEDTEITGLDKNGNATDMSGGGQPLVSRTGYTLRRVNAYGYGDILRMDGNAVVENSWLHDPKSAGGADPHNDVAQSTNATYIRLKHNRMELNATQTSLILLKADIGPISDVIVEDNLFNGGGYSVYWYDAKYKSTGGIFRNNKWQRAPTGGFMPKGGYWGPVAMNTATMPVWENNVWQDTNAPINP